MRTYKQFCVVDTSGFNLKDEIDRFTCGWPSNCCIVHDFTTQELRFTQNYCAHLAIFYVVPSTPRKLSMAEIHYHKNFSRYTCSKACKFPESMKLSKSYDLNERERVDRLITMLLCLISVPGVKNDLLPCSVHRGMRPHSDSAPVYCSERFAMKGYSLLQNGFIAIVQLSRIQCGDTSQKFLNYVFVKLIKLVTLQLETEKFRSRQKLQLLLFRDLQTCTDYRA